MTQQANDTPPRQYLVTVRDGETIRYRCERGRLSRNRAEAHRYLFPAVARADAARMRAQHDAVDVEEDKQEAER